MNRISRILGTASALMLLLGAIPVASQTALQKPVIDLTSSGLITFAREERAIRVAAVFAAQDTAVVPTLIRFVDRSGNVLKQVTGELSDNNAVVAELTRDDVAGLGDLLVRVEVIHKLPGVRRERYPIIVTIQPIGPTGPGSLVLTWSGGICGIPFPPGTLPAQTIPPGTQVTCNPPAFQAF
jgi:hypothetical protein